MNAPALNPSRDDLCDAADLALTLLAQEVPEGHQMTVIAAIRPALRELRHGGTDLQQTFALIDSLPVAAELLQPLRRAVIAMTVVEP